ncbi:glutamate receptor-like [Haliotis rufescens]|uniref:glutamate receptor-like n=1 Tax=Haliotis rufescens TaxID=6454 RepID=UPI00201EAE3F|nr:glutamate receptor-like [Haliotis rufescens]
MSERGYLWLLLVCLELTALSATCRMTSYNVTIGTILHPSWMKDVTQPEMRSHRSNCRVNITILTAILDTDNEFLLRLKVTSLRSNDPPADLILIGPSSTTCSPPRLGTTLGDDDSIMTLPCPSQHGHDSTPSSTWLPQSTFHDAWEFMASYTNAIPQDTLVILYEENTAGRFLGQFLEKHLPSSLDMKLMMYSTETLSATTRWRSELAHIHNRTYVKGIYGILLGSESTLLEYMQEINNFDALFPRTTDFRHRSFWLVITQTVDIHVLENVSRDLENMAVISPGISPYDHDMNASIESLVLEKTFSGLGKNLNVCGNMTSAAVVCVIAHHLESAFQTAESERLYVHVAEGVGDTHHYVKHPLSKTRADLNDFLFPNVKYGYNLRHMNITIQPWPGFMERVDDGNATTYQGMCIEMLKVLQEALNFTYTLYENKDQTWGVVEDGSWIGMVGELHRREADLALADITIHYQRDQVVDFVLPAFRREVTDIVYRKWKTEDFNWKHLTRPFTPLVVLCITAALVFVMLMVAVTERLNPYYSGMMERQSPLEISWKTVWYLLGSVLMQGGTQEPGSCTGRVLLSTWWIFCIVIAATYSATLIVSFAVQEEAVPFKSLTDLVENEEYRWGLFDGSIAMLILTNSTRPEFQKALDGVRKFAQSDPSVLSRDIEVQLHKVQTEKYALISSRATLEYMQSVSRPLDLRIVGENLYSTHVALAVPPDSPFLPDFERVMSTMSEIGLLETWEETWWNHSYLKNPSVTLGGQPITIGNFLNALCLVAIGVACGVTALLLEYVIERIRRCYMASFEKKTEPVTACVEDHVVDMT